MSKKIFILLGHTFTTGIGGTLADVYEKAAREAGHEVKRLNIGDLKFDPVLHDGYRAIQTLEPDLLKVQEYIKWCDTWFIVYPMWWSSMPALLKGLFDRIWLPGFAFHFWPSGYGWTKLLKGKTAHVVVTSDSIPVISYILFGDSSNEINRAILKFAGFRVRSTKIGWLKNVSPARIERLKRKIARFGRKGC